MRIIKVENYEQLSREVADLIAAEIREKPKCVLGLATGSTPVGAYKLLVRAYESGEIDFSEITSVNLDEYCGLPPDNPESYRRFMDENLFNHINIDKAKTHVPNGMAESLDAEAKGYEALIKSLGGIDLQLLGMGHNGHIGFNEPDEEFKALTHHVHLAEQTIKANSRFFESPEDVPKSAITMGIETIMHAKKIIIAVSGNDKANILKKALFGTITPRIPASILRLHNNLTVVTDCLT
ncbi:MAG: glucosamine-6-phosphate deaminase [Oscillospiraceae bacterium]|nr:glucosamine-6-phosphate deaminase [Oscillospiraceae bacterium]